MRKKLAWIPAVVAASNPNRNSRTSRKIYVIIGLFVMLLGFGMMFFIIFGFGGSIIFSMIWFMIIGVGLIVIVFAGIAATASTRRSPHQFHLEKEQYSYNSKQNPYIQRMYTQRPEVFDYERVSEQRHFKNESFFCKNCGERLDSGAIFCPECGSKVNIDS